MRFIFQRNFVSKVNKSFLKSKCLKIGRKKIEMTNQSRDPLVFGTKTGNSKIFSAFFQRWEPKFARKFSSTLQHKHKALYFCVAEINVPKC